ncbi:MAG: hypothetical protein ACREOZ_03915, partial [Gloeomargaritales cyanobacterium]
CDPAPDDDTIQCLLKLHNKDGLRTEEIEFLFTTREKIKEQPRRDNSLMYFSFEQDVKHSQQVVGTNDNLNDASAIVTDDFAPDSEDEDNVQTTSLFAV